jgi:hypothetical protein
VILRAAARQNGERGKQVEKRPRRAAHRVMDAGTDQMRAQINSAAQ